jgi:hypothetical protein
MFRTSLTAWQCKVGRPLRLFTSGQRRASHRCRFPVLFGDSERRADVHISVDLYLRFFG